MSANRYLPAARSVAWAIPEILAQCGLKPHISRFVLTETGQGAAWLFIILAVSPRDRLEKTYAAANVLYHLFTALRGHPVVFSNSEGFRYAVLLSASPYLRQALPGFQFNEQGWSSAPPPQNKEVTLA
jgi:hypothetical protein